MIVKNNNNVLLANLLERTRYEMPDVQEQNLRQAQERGDTESAAAIARAIRNRLLAETDKEMTLDRLSTTFDLTSALGFISSLKEMISGAMAKYRQELRDITQQDGFPLSFEFPKNPNDESEGDVWDL